MNAKEPDARFDTRDGFVDALLRTFEAGIHAGSRRIVCCDPDFADWPLDAFASLAPLVAWLKQPQRRLVLLAGGYDAVPRRHPRFTAWRRDWSHAVDAWKPADDNGPELPTLLLADAGVGVQLVDRTHWRGAASRDARRVRLWLEAIDAQLQRSERAFAVQCLGL